MLECLLCLRHQVEETEMGEDKRLEMDVKVFLWRKNVVVGKLDESLEVFAAAFGVELKAVLRHEMGLVLVFVVEAMHARLGRIDEAACQMMVFGTIMELHVPSHGDEKHH